MPGFVEAGYEQSLAASREQLGEEAFASAWQEGRGLTLEQAITCALEVTPAC
jgi:hypothetical protein